MENSIAKINTPGGTGTCYFLAKNIVATCYHVIEKVFLTEDIDSVNKWNACEIAFTETFYDEQNIPQLKPQPHERKIKELLNYDKDGDIAILELESEISEAEPVTLSIHNTLPVDTAWRSRGYPAIVSNGASLDGKIKSLAAYDINEQQRIELKAERIDENNIGGYSGSPVFVGGKVIGHLTSNAEKVENGQRKNIFGLVYAISGAHIRKAAKEFVPELRDDFGLAILTGGEIYIKRGIEAIISDDMLNKGGVCLTGYLKSGRTRIISYFKEFEKHAIFLDIPPQNITSAFVDLKEIIENRVTAGTLESLLKFFCDAIVIDINSSEKSFSPPVWSNDTYTKPGIASDWFKKEILSYFEQEKKRLFIYIDNGEEIFNHFERQICKDFFGMINAWAKAAKNAGVAGILMTLNNTIFLENLMRPAAFDSASARIFLEDFNDSEIKMFAEKYFSDHKLSGQGLTDDQVKEIIKWTGGNPGLVQLLFDGIRQEKTKNPAGFDFDETFKKIINNRIYYEKYLEGLEGELWTNELIDELRLYQIDYAEISAAESDVEAHRKLVKSGVIKEQLNDGGKNLYKLRCGLFKF